MTPTNYYSYYFGAVGSASAAGMTTTNSGSVPSLSRPEAECASSSMCESYYFTRSLTTPPPPPPSRPAADENESSVRRPTATTQSPPRPDHSNKNHESMTAPSSRRRDQQQAPNDDVDDDGASVTPSKSGAAHTPLLLTLRSGDGTTVRQALYTGPIDAATGQATGYGTLLFVETGDTYQGQVVNGQMCGQGTYTFANNNNNNTNSSPRHSRSSRRRVLKGRFERNVYMGMGV